MFAESPTVRVTATCTFCHARNELTINSVTDDSVITCSTCGGRLGTLHELVGHGEDPPVARRRARVRS